MPLAKDLVLNHLHFVLAFAIAPQFRVFPDVFEEDLFYFTPLGLRYSLRAYLGRR